MLSNSSKQKIGLLDEAVFVVGDGELASSVVANMLNAGQQVWFYTADALAAQRFLQLAECDPLDRLRILDKWPDFIPAKLAIAIVGEDVTSKLNVVNHLEMRMSNDAVIAINLQCVTLENLQKDTGHPNRIVGLNWCYPAHITFFLEIITNHLTEQSLVEALDRIARDNWEKDPYIVSKGFSTRARMMAAWTREAIYLVDNGFATMESIDRACRNDPGYYLPFAGNFRYMDLMGTYAYGLVMKDLNPDLSTDTHVPESFPADLTDFTSDSGKQDPELFLRFSQDIRKLIKKYAHETIDR